MTSMVKILIISVKLTVCRLGGPMKLFAVLLGGRAPGCNIELHDVVFIVAPSLTDAYPRLVHKWFGTSKRLHIDSSVALTIIDGYEIQLSKEKPQNQELCLYFVNFGGYKPGYFGELHEMSFYVANAKSDVVARAKESLCVGSFQQHCDDNLEINALLAKSSLEMDDMIRIDQIDEYYIHLVPTTKMQPLEVESSYRRLDVPDIIEKANQLLSTI